MRITQKANILRHLQQGKTITQREAIALCNCYRLSAVIFELRSVGYRVDSNMRCDSFKTFVIIS
ncbi:helix-turn-helix domain-containing protein [Acinetobacter gerneri]|uniref:helix-turn-helix domain-containing protein n=1 Tax=Acinetobacter gerneri TaxID=202952 RepID=UPI002935E478|nr:helix-turn-helix domain-containing protein [Acinetobacter gerneri]MDV2438006.1 helix-turn-helix domain-containing protein [Acinetobacter gerneri]